MIKSRTISKKNKIRLIIESSCDKNNMMIVCIHRARPGGKSYQTQARLGRFLSSETWESQFTGVTQSLLPRPDLDHHPMLLVGNGMR